MALLLWDLGVVLLIAVLVSDVQAATMDLYMDSPTACGKTFYAGDREVFQVKPRGSVGVSNPPTSCPVYFESSHASTNYKFEIVVEAAAFRDCGLSLRIFDGKSTGSNYIRMLGCGSTTSTGHFYSKDRAMTLLLSRTQNQYFFGSDYQLRIQLYYDTEGADEYIGTTKFPAGAIIGIILGVIVFIAAAILLGWCYKTGRLPGLSPYDYPPTTVKASSENLSKIEPSLDGNGSNNGGFVSWHNKESKSVLSESRSNFNLEDSTIWESLTSINANTPKKDNVRPVARDNVNGRGVGRGGLSQNDINKRNNNTGNFQRLDANQLSNSPKTRVRGRKEGQKPDYDNNKNIDNNFDTYHTINDFARESSDRLLKGKGTFGADNEKNGKQNSSGVFVNPDKEGYMYDYEHVKKLSGDDENVIKPKTQDFATELQAAIKRASIKRQKSENQTDSDGQGLSGKDTQNESSDFSSSAALNKHTDGEMTGPDAQSSPKPKKKKRKSSKDKKSPKSPRKHKNKDNNENNVPQSTDSNPYDNISGEEVPPELYAPIFSDEEVPEALNQYQPGYQGNYPPAAPFDPRYPMGPYQPGMPGMYPPGMPYQQAGQAQWYVESNPNGQQKMAFAMTTHSQSDDSLRDNYVGPNYTSTPYYPTQGQRPAPNDMSMVPAGTILDDPQLPAPGTSLVRYDEDPLSGVKTSQVVWTDARKDPTDPPPDSATQITRKTITRITTKATEDELPGAPNPNLQDMSWRTAQGIQETRGHEPPFMSPTRGAYQAKAIQYASETPERSNAGYYMGSQRNAPGPPMYHTGPAPPVIHEAPKGNEAIRDRIVLHSESDT